MVARAVDGSRRSIEVRSRPEQNASWHQHRQDDDHHTVVWHPIGTRKRPWVFSAAGTFGACRRSASPRVPTCKVRRPPWRAAMPIPVWPPCPAEKVRFPWTVTSSNARRNRRPPTAAEARRASGAMNQVRQLLFRKRDVKRVSVSCLERAFHLAALVLQLHGGIAARRDGHSIPGNGARFRVRRGVNLCDVIPLARPIRSDDQHAIRPPGVTAHVAYGALPCADSPRWRLSNGAACDGQKRRCDSNDG